MTLYLRETLLWLYNFWMRPLTAYRLLKEAGLAIAPESSDLQQLKVLPPSAKRVLGQLVLGNLFALIFGTMLTVWVSDIIGVADLAETSYWFRVVCGVMIGMVGVVCSVAAGFVEVVIASVMVGIGASVLKLGSTDFILPNSDFTPVWLGIAAWAGTVGILMGILIGTAISVNQLSAGYPEVENSRGELAPGEFVYSVMIPGCFSSIVLLVGYGIANVIYAVSIESVANSIRTVTNCISLFFLWMAIGMGSSMVVSLIFFLLLRYPVWAVWSGAIYFLVRLKKIQQSATLFHWGPPQLDDFIWWPLPFYAQFLWQCIELAPAEQATEMLRLTANRRQRSSIPFIYARWASQSSSAATSLPALATVAQQCNRMANFYDNMTRPNRTQIKQMELWRNFAAVAHALSQIEEAHNRDTAQRILTRYLGELDTLKLTAGWLNQPLLSEMGAHWQRLIRQYNDQLEAMGPRQRLIGSYQFGTSINSSSSLFRGRGDLFETIQQLYADPHHAETLLLIAQQRMGKSSALNQLSVQLPNAYILFVDCQGVTADLTTAQFPVAFSQAIYNWEKAKPGGMRLKPLAERDGPNLQHLGRWLEQFADQDQVQNKRIVLALDEFDKLLGKVVAGELSAELLGFLRALSQSRRWLIIYSGQYELDDWSAAYGEYLKNVHRLRIAYLRKEEAEELIRNPVPHFGLTYEDAAVDSILHWTGRHPYLLQMMGKLLVDRLVAEDRRLVTDGDVSAVIDQVFDTGRYYFDGVWGRFSAEDKRVLHQIAQTEQSDAEKRVVRRLQERDYIVPTAGGGWRLAVPLWQRWLTDFVAEES